MKHLSHDLKRNMYKLKGYRGKNAFDLWWHSFTGVNVITGEAKSFFVEYYILNPSVTPNKVVLGQREDNKLYKIQPSYVMIKAGAWGDDACQIHNFYPAEEMISQQKYLDIQIGSCKLSEITISGSVHVAKEEVDYHPECLSDAGSMSWDLKVNKTLSTGKLEKKRFLRKPEMHWHGQGIKTEYSGRIVFNGEEYLVEAADCNGYADKRWGVRFPNPFFTIYASNIVSDFNEKKMASSALVIYNQISGFNQKETLQILLYLDGKQYHFTSVIAKKQSKIAYSMTKNEDDNILQWTITAEKQNILMDILVYCKESEMLNLVHESSSGELQFEDMKCGGTGWGHLKMYHRKNKTLEIIENLSFKNVVCYGK
ncbi:MAG: hypothetical protein ACRC4W_02345 [Treponemataceae bacterium]